MKKRSRSGINCCSDFLFMHKNFEYFSRGFIITHLFCVSTYTYAPFVRFFAKNPTRKSWIFSFVPSGTTSFACLHATSFERQLNIIAARGTNERGCDKSQMMYFVMMLRLWRKRCCALRKRNCSCSFVLLICS